jgi:hypothetical protein
MDTYPYGHLPSVAHFETKADESLKTAVQPVKLGSLIKKDYVPLIPVIGLFSCFELGENLKLFEQ